MKRIFIFLPLLLLLPVLALGQDRFNEVGAVYGAIRSMTPEAYKEAHDKYGIRWIEAWTGNLTGGTEEQYDAWIERFNTAMKGSGLKLWSVHLPLRARHRMICRMIGPNGARRHSRTGLKSLTVRRVSANFVW